MAYVSIVTKQSVTKQKNGEYRISIYVVITDDSDSSIVLEKDYSMRYSLAWSIGDIKTKFQKLIQADWDNLIDQQAIFDAVAFDTMVGEIKTSIDTYTN